MTEISVTELSPQPAAVIRQTVAMTELTQFFDRAYHELPAVMAEQGVAIAGPPYALYRGMPTQTVDVEAGFPCIGQIAPAGSVVPGTLPGGRVYQAVHTGSYDGLTATYSVLTARMAADGVQPADFMWEQYLTDPAQEPDPARWRTLVSWPVG